MNRRLQRGRLAAAIAVLCVTVLGVAYYRRLGGSFSPGHLAAGIPAPAGILFFIDAAGLRRSDILELLSGPTVMEEPEYRAFVERTGFDYRKDLDAILASIEGDAVFAYVQGRFQHQSLKEYAVAQGGACDNGVCRLAASRENRFISFRPLRRNLLAFAVSTDPLAVNRLPAPGTATLAVPAKPVWITVSGQTLRDTNKWPEAAQVLAKAFSGAQEITLAFGPAGERLEMTLNASCVSEERAAALTGDLDKATAFLQTRLEGKGDPRDLSTVLARGRFERRGLHVAGVWPLERVFLTSLAGGAF